LKFLISVVNKEEAFEAYRGGANILDIKNPKEGSIGANFAWIIKDIVNSFKGKVEISATIGDLTYLPGMASLACYGALNLDVDYIKAGFYKLTLNQARDLAKSLIKTINMKGNTKLVMVSFADYREFKGLSYWELLKVAKDYGFDGFLLDLKLKNEKCIFDYISKEEMMKIKEFCKENSIIFGLAGGLKFDNLKEVKEINPDVVGFRRGVLSKGKVDESLVKKIILDLLYYYHG